MRKNVSWKEAKRRPVSMNSGLEDRNNLTAALAIRAPSELVSMKSGPESRNNREGNLGGLASGQVSMKSGLEGRNNLGHHLTYRQETAGLNGVRPRKPEQFEQGSGENLNLIGSH